VVISITFAGKFILLNGKIKVSAVSYLNTKPLLYGIERHKMRNRIELILEYPSMIATHLQNGSIDVGLVPVAAIPVIPNAKIISEYGIAAKGKVASVCIFSHVPIEEVRCLYLDYQSRTSVKLAEILIRNYWKKEIEFLSAPQNYIDLIKGGTAGVIIGDRALQQLNHFEYVYDLAEHWHIFTGLDFMFAAWVTNKELSKDFIASFDEANAVGLLHLPEVIAQNPFPYYDLHTYYTQNIQFKLDKEKHRGKDLFLKYLREMQSFV
jgi:chorismate dehydratase